MKKIKASGDFHLAMYALFNANPTRADLANAIFDLIEGARKENDATKQVKEYLQAFEKGLDAAVARIGNRVLTAEVSEYNTGYGDACRDIRQDILALKSKLQ